MGEPLEASAEGENKNPILGWVPEKEKVKMKKLMFAAVAGLAISDFAIESANVVGKSWRGVSDTPRQFFAHKRRKFWYNVGVLRD